jgi:tetratricopeptide (TPR) repeat protein
MLESNRVPQSLLLVGIAAVGVAAWFFVAPRSSLPESYRYAFNASLETRERTRTGAFAKEIAFYQARATRNPSDGLDLAALAGAYLSRARVTGENAWYTLAESAAERSLANLPVFNAGARLALAEVRAARHDFQGALEVIGDVTRTEPRNGSAVSLRAGINLAVGNLAVARRDADALVNAAPNPSNLALRASILEAQGSSVTAQRDYERALALEEADDVFTSARTRALFGRYWLRQGNTALARALLEEALRLAPNYPLAALHLANLELGANNLDRAEAVYVSLRGAAGSPSTYDHAALIGQAKIHALRGSGDAESLWTSGIALLRQEVQQGAFGHRRELARALLERGRDADVREALENARLETKTRRDAETLAVLEWAQTRCAKLRCEGER